MKKTCAICNKECGMGVWSIMKVKDGQWVCRECIEKANLSTTKASLLSSQDIATIINGGKTSNEQVHRGEICQVDETDKPKFIFKGQNGQLYVYDNKVEITRKGVFGLAFQGLKGTKTILISEIKSIQVKKGGMFPGYIQFGISGGIESRNGVQDAARDENTITFDFSQNNEAEEIKKYIENKVLNQTKTQNTVVQQTSDADEILKFKQLLDAGIITQEEFDAKKKQLLGL